MLGQTVIRFMYLPLIAKIVEQKHVYAASFVVPDIYSNFHQNRCFRNILYKISPLKLPFLLGIKIFHCPKISTKIIFSCVWWVFLIVLLMKAFYTIPLVVTIYQSQNSNYIKCEQQLRRRKKCHVVNNFFVQQNSKIIRVTIKNIL